MVDVNKLDTEFIRKAEKVTSFNIAAADFTHLKFKNEIQHLFQKHFFPGFDLSTASDSTSITARDANRLIDKLRTMDFSAFNNLHFYNLKGVGPGEATLFFLYNKAHLGGGTSAGVDLVCGSNKYEIKAAKLDKDGQFVSGFKLGGTVPLGDLVDEAVSYKNAMGFTTAGKGQSEVNKTQMEAIAKEYPKQWERITKEYAKRAFQYFENDNVIFMNNNNSNGRLTRAAGGVITVKRVKQADIGLDVITQGTMKPKVTV